MILFDFTWVGYQIFWTIVVACLCGVTCSILGCFLLVKRLSLLGDGISHGVLPGIALAVLFTGQLNSVWVLAAAMAFGILTAVAADRLSSLGNISEDAGLGIVFTTLFALGVIVISRFLYHVHVDTDSVLFGLLDGVDTRTILLPFDLGELPSAVPTLCLMLALTVGMVALFWKEWLLVAFDASLAQAMGFAPAWMNYLLIALVAGAIVASFEAVGSILVLAMLVVPPATAYLLCERMPAMVVWSVALSISASVLGCWIASYRAISVSSPGMMAVVVGVQFALAVVLAPKTGLLAKAWRHFQLSARIAREEILGALYRMEESGAVGYPLATKDHGLSPTMIWWAQLHLRRQGWIEEAAEGQFTLTLEGRRQAQELVRVHRLLETYAGKVFDLPPDHVHAPASWLEHFIGPQLMEELATTLDRPSQDPHGKKIPEEPTPTFKTGDDSINSPRQD